MYNTQILMYVRQISRRFYRYFNLKEQAVEISTKRSTWLIKRKIVIGTCRSLETFETSLVLVETPDIYLVELLRNKLNKFRKISVLVVTDKYLQKTQLTILL